MKSRESNFDLLRIFCAVAVILLHVSSDFVAMSFTYNLGEQDALFKGNLLLSFVLDTIPRFAVPCFVMLSGAFILADKRNMDITYFYKKSFRNVGIQMLIFSLLYTIYGILKRIIKILKNGGSVISLFYPIKMLLIGRPFFHMWYLFMLAILYLITPFYLVMEDGLIKRGKNLRGGVYWIFLILASLSYWTSTYKLSWDIGTSFCYFSYFLTGYKIREWTKERKNNFIGVSFILFGFVVALFLACMRFKLASTGITIQLGGDVIVTTKKLEIFAYEGLDPFVVISAVPIFAGFSFLNVKNNRYITKFASATFFIYLFHGGVWDITKILLQGKNISVLKTNFAIPFCMLIVLCASIFLAKTYLKVWKCVYSRWNMRRGKYSKAS